jgi:hypothetical protein
MWGSIIRVVGVVLLTVIVVSIVSPWFDLQPSTGRMSRLSVAQFSLAVAPILLDALMRSTTFLTGRFTLPSHAVHDIVARDCARLC